MYNNNNNNNNALHNFRKNDNFLPEVCNKYKKYNEISILSLSCLFCELTYR